MQTRPNHSGTNNPGAANPGLENHILVCYWLVTAILLAWVIGQTRCAQIACDIGGC